VLVSHFGCLTNDGVSEQKPTSPFGRQKSPSRQLTESYLRISTVYTSESDLYELL